MRLKPIEIAMIVMIALTMGLILFNALFGA
jgi:hypothetical protein